MAPGVCYIVCGIQQIVHGRPGGVRRASWNPYAISDLTQNSIPYFRPKRLQTIPSWGALTRASEMVPSRFIWEKEIERDRSRHGLFFCSGIKILKCSV